MTMTRNILEKREKMTIQIINHLRSGLRLNYNSGLLTFLKFKGDLVGAVLV